MNTYAWRAAALEQTLPAARKKMRKRDKHLLRGPQGSSTQNIPEPQLTWSFFYRCSCGLDLNACHVQTFSFRAITTEDFRKQGPSTAQVEARWEQECCALSWFNLYLTPAKQVSKDAAGPSRRSNRKNKGGSNFPSLLICATSRNYSVGFCPLQGK